MYIFVQNQRIGNFRGKTSPPPPSQTPRCSGSARTPEYAYVAGCSLEALPQMTRTRGSVAPRSSGVGRGRGVQTSRVQFLRELIDQKTTSGLSNFPHGVGQAGWQRSGLPAGPPTGWTRAEPRSPASRGTHSHDSRPLASPRCCFKPTS